MPSKSKKIGPITVRPQVRKGLETGRWFVDIPGQLMPNGQRKRKLFDTQREALNTARRLKKGLESQSFGLVEKKKPKGRRFKDVVQQWVEQEKSQVECGEKKSSSLEVDRHRLKSLLMFFKDHDIILITSKLINEFKVKRLNGELNLNQRLQGKLSPSTVNSDLRTLLKVLRWAHEEEYIEHVPTVRMLKEIRKRVEVPTLEECQRILAELDPKARPVVWFLAETGCRRGEVFNLTWDSVNEVQGWFEIAPREDWSPKTEESERRLPLSQGLLEMLRSLPKEGRYVFPSRLDPNKPRVDVRKALAAAVKRAGVVRDGEPLHVTPKTFRKAFATHQVEGGTSERVLQEMLGHSAGSRVTNRHYVQPTEHAMVKAANLVQLHQPQKKIVGG